MIPAIRARMADPLLASIVLVPESLAIGHAIADILLLDQRSVEGDWDGGVIYLPLR